MNKMTALLMEGIVNGEVGSKKLKPNALKITRTSRDAFTLEIINHKGEALAKVTEFTLKTGSSAVLFNFNRCFEIKVSENTI